MDLKEYVFLKIDNSGLSLRHLKCGVWVFSKSNNGCMCTSGEVAASLLKVAISLIQAKRSPGYYMASSFRSRVGDQIWIIKSLFPDIRSFLCLLYNMMAHLPL